MDEKLKLEEGRPLGRRDWLDDPENEEQECGPEGDGPQPIRTMLDAIRPLGKGECMASVGLAQIKRTVILDGVERVEILQVPITTKRIDAVKAEFSDKRRPVPPTKAKVILPDSELGQAMGFVKKQVCEVAQVDDPKFVRALEQFNEKAGWAMAAEAVDVPLYYNAGEGEPKPATTTSEKVQAIKEAGFTEAQVLEISRTIGRVSHWSDEERRRFFGECLE